MLGYHQRIQVRHTTPKQRCDSWHTTNIMRRAPGEGSEDRTGKNFHGIQRAGSQVGNKEEGRGWSKGNDMAGRGVRGAGQGGSSRGCPWAGAVLRGQSNALHEQRQRAITVARAVAVARDDEGANDDALHEQRQRAIGQRRQGRGRVNVDSFNGMSRPSKGAVKGSRHQARLN
jgi:hypothetical protein